MKIFARLSWAYATFMIFASMALMIIIFPIFRSPRSQKISAWIIRTLLFIPIRVKGEENPDAQMFLLNHQSDIDIGILETITKRNLAWVAKKELFDVPFYGLLLKLPNDIAVERESKTSLIKLIKDVKSRLDDGRVITMFPEGTRSSNGRMLPFKPGAKMVADKYRLLVQPIVIIEAAAYYNIKKYHYRPGQLTAIYMDAFEADKRDKEWLTELRVKMQKVYDDELRVSTRS
ncbi:MAG: lysophospholipid acyltransferase family protein [Campylobacterota bacterium]|nr:lysophospholipid acyltransferase family protein [Campylobacterota bacterium]